MNGRILLCSALLCSALLCFTLLCSPLPCLALPCLALLVRDVWGRCALTGSDQRSHGAAVPKCLEMTFRSRAEGRFAALRDKTRRHWACHTRCRDKYCPLLFSKDHEITRMDNPFRAQYLEELYTELYVASRPFKPFSEASVCILNQGYFLAASPATRREMLHFNLCRSYCGAAGV